MSRKYILKAIIFVFTFLFPLLAVAQSTNKDARKIKKGEISASQYFKESGYVNYTGIDILTGGETTSVRFGMVNGYRFSPKFSAGIGIGFILYDDPLSLIPLFLDLKYKFLETDVSPFAFLKSGYSFSILTDEDTQFDNHSGGFMLNPGIGLQFETNSEFGWYLNAGYNLDHSNLERERFDGRIVETDISYRRLMFGMGLSF